MRQQDTAVDVEEELEVVLKARQELGKDHEDEVIESFLSRVQESIDARVEARVNEALRGVPTRPRLASPSNGRIRVVLGYMVGCLALSIPIAAVAGGEVATIAVIGCVTLGGAILILPDGKVRTELGPGPSEREKKK